MVCVEAGACKTLEMKPKGAKLVDASGMAGTCGEGRACRGKTGVVGVYGKCWAQKRQVRTYFCLERAGNLCDKTWKDAASHWRERALNVEKKWKNAASQPRSEPEEEEDEPDEPDDDDDDDDDDVDDDDDDVDDDDDADDDADHRDDDDVNKVSARQLEKRDETSRQETTRGDTRRY